MRIYIYTLCLLCNENKHIVQHHVVYLDCKIVCGHIIACKVSEIQGEVCSSVPFHLASMWPALGNNRVLILDHTAPTARNSMRSTKTHAYCHCRMCQNQNNHVYALLDLETTLNILGHVQLPKVLMLITILYL